MCLWLSYEWNITFNERGMNNTKRSHDKRRWNGFKGGWEIILFLFIYFSSKDDDSGVVGRGGYGIGSLSLVGVFFQRILFDAWMSFLCQFFLKKLKMKRDVKENAIVSYLIWLQCMKNYEN